MSASRPGKGPIATTGLITLQRTRARRAHDGSWRPNRPFATHGGLLVTMRRAAGVSEPDVLAVPMRFQAPVVGDLNRPELFDWSTYNTLRLGQRSRPMGPELKQFTLSTLLLDRVAQDTSSGIVVWPYAPNPQKVIDELRWIAGLLPKSKPSPFRLTISQPGVWDGVVNMLAVLTGISPTQKSEEIGSEYIDLTFLQFQDDEIARQRQPREDEKTRYHDRRHGDTLYSLATRYYHQPSAWRRIAEANGIKKVSPRSSEALEDWCAAHHKNRLRIPPAPRARAN